MLAYIKGHLLKLIRLSERYTKTDMVYLTQGGFWLGLGQVCAAATAFLLSLVVARYLSQETYGAYKYLLSLAAIVGAVSLTGIGTSVTQAIARGFEGTLKKSVFQNLIWSIPMVLIFFGIGAYYAWNDNWIYASAMVVAGIATPLINSSVLYAAYLSGKKDFRRHALYWALGNIVSTGALIGTILLTNSLIILIAVYFVSTALVNVCAYYATLKTYRPNREVDTGSLSYAKHLSVMGVLNTVTANIDKILVFQFLGPAQLAIYSFANAIPEQMRAFVKAGARLSFPKYAEQQIDSIRKPLWDKLLRFGTLILLGSIVYALLAPYAYTYLFPAYAASIPYSQAIAFSLVFALGFIPLSALQAHAKTKELYAHSIITNIVQIGTTVTLIGLFGLWGAVCALLINRAVGFFLPLFLLYVTKQKAV